MKVFSPRRVITNRKDIADVSLDGEDPVVKKNLHSRIKRLRRQVVQLTIEKSEMDQENMNILSSMEREKNHELSLMTARIKIFEESNTFLKVSKNSLVNRVLDLDRKLTLKQEVLDEEKSRIQALVKKIDEYELQAPGDDSWDQDQVTKVEKKSVLTSSNVNNGIIEKALQQLDSKCARGDEMAEKYNSKVKRNILLKEEIQIMAHKDTINQRLPIINEDTDDSLLQEKKKNDTVKEEYITYKENKVKLDKTFMSTTVRGIDQITHAAHNVLSCQENALEQGYIKEIEGSCLKLKKYIEGTVTVGSTSMNRHDGYIVSGGSSITSKNALLYFLMEVCL